MYRIGLRCARREAALVLTFVRRAASLAWLYCCLPMAAWAQQNMSFEALDERGVPQGWSAAGASALASDDAVATDGRRSLRLTPTSGGISRAVQRVSATVVRPNGARRVRLRGFVQVPGAAVAASLWVRIDGPKGPLFLDSFGDARDAVGDPQSVSLKVPYGLATSSSAVSEHPSDATTAAAAGWQFHDVELPLPTDVDEIAFGVSVRGQGSAWFDGLELDVDELSARPVAAPAPTRYLDAALALMREHSLRRSEVDWPELRGRAFEQARGATTSRDVHSAVRFAVRELGDRHSYLQSPAATRVLARTAVSNARTGSPPVAPRAERLAGNLAYVDVPSFAGGTPLQQVEFAEDLKNIIQANDSDDICGWVVDLRQNSGGNLWPMLAGLGPLLGDGELGASVYPDGRRVPFWHRDGQAGFGDYTQLRVRTVYRRRTTAPVAVLQGRGTASSAEVLAVAFRSRSDTRFFGAATRGLSAGNRTFPLADGAALVLTVAGTSDTRGRLYAGPIPPDVSVPERRESTAEGLDATLDAAMAWLTGDDRCR